MLAIITVIFSEEEDELTSSNEISKEQSLSLNSSDSQSSLAGAVLNVFAAVYEEGQQEASRPPPDSPQEQTIVCEPACLFGNVLHLVPPTEGNLMESEDEVMVTWASSPNQVNENATDAPRQV